MASTKQRYRRRTVRARFLLMENSYWLERGEETNYHFCGKMHYALWLFLLLSLSLTLSLSVVSAVIPLDLIVGNKELAGGAFWLLWLYTLLLIVLCPPFELNMHCLLRNTKRSCVSLNSYYDLTL